MRVLAAHCFLLPRFYETGARLVLNREYIELCVIVPVGKQTVITGGGDVFADLAFSPAESRKLRLRSQMMRAVRKFVEDEGG